jgi:hypothetical protein
MVNRPIREVDLNTLDWRRSSLCSASSCLEVAFRGDDVLVRNSQDPEGLVLRFTREEWVVFVAGVKGGEFDAA